MCVCMLVGTFLFILNVGQKSKYELGFNVICLGNNDIWLFDFLGLTLCASI